MRKFCLFFCLLSSLCFAADLLKKGEPCADIVISREADAGTQLAARTLQKYLQLIAGAEFKCVFPEQTTAAVQLCVGESECSQKAGYEAPAFAVVGSGYDIWVKENCVVLSGPSFAADSANRNAGEGGAAVSRQFALADDCGCLHAVSALLEKIGVRFYAPSLEGTKIPVLKDISLPEGRTTEQAAFPVREYGHLRCTPDVSGEEFLWLKMLKAGSALPHVRKFYLAEVLKADGGQHPEWLARNQEGQLILSQEGCGVPKYFSASFQDACIAELRKLLDAEPNCRRILLVEPNGRELCDAQEKNSIINYGHEPDPIESNVRFTFALRVAQEVGKSHPDCTILWRNTKNSMLPDERYLSQKPENLQIIPDAISANTYANPGQLAKVKEILEPLAVGEEKPVLPEWWNEPETPAVCTLGFWSFYSLQKFRQEQTRLLTGVKMEIPGVDSSNGQALSPLLHLPLYVNSKLLWNPETDLDALLKEYCEFWYGPAAQEMEDFLVYAAFAATKDGARSISKKNGKLTQVDARVVFSLLGKARARTADGSVYRKRIEELLDSYAWLENIFQDRMPGGEKIQSEVLPYSAQCDGDLGKYTTWYPLSGVAEKTECAVAFREDRKVLMVAFRCYEPGMENLAQESLPVDSPLIFARDHVEVQFYTSYRGIYTVALDCAGSLYDGADDPAEMDSNGCIAGWNSPLTRGCVRHYADRWEAELFIDIKRCGATPDWDAPWGLQAARVRYAKSESKEVAVLADAETSSTREWRALTLPQVDTQGRTCMNTRHVIIPLSDDPRAGYTYTIRKARGAVSLSDAWDGESWKEVPELRLAYEIRYQYPPVEFHPDARAKIQYDDEYIYVLYQVKDQYVRGDTKNDQEGVSLDSCMEIFLRPNATGPYYNFEANCIGTLLLFECLQIGEGYNYRFTPIPAEDLQKVKRFSTLPRDMTGEIQTPITWRLGLQIPVELFVRHAKVQLPLSRQVWSGNVLKTSDHTSHPCRLLWTPTSDFHMPKEFGTLIFE